MRYNDVTPSMGSAFNKPFSKSPFSKSKHTAEKRGSEPKPIPARLLRCLSDAVRSGTVPLRPGTPSTPRLRALLSLVSRLRAGSHRSPLRLGVPRRSRRGQRRCPGPPPGPSPEGRRPARRPRRPRSVTCGAVPEGRGPGGGRLLPGGVAQEEVEVGEPPGLPVRARRCREGCAMRAPGATAVLRGGGRREGRGEERAVYTDCKPPGE